MAGTKVERTVLKALHVTLDNRPGALAQATRALADAKINIEAIQSEILGRSAFFRFYTQNSTEAERVLKTHGFVTIGMDIVEVILPNKPGELARMCETLSGAGVNIESCFGSAHGPNKETRIYLRVDKPQEAHRVLTGAQFEAHRHDR